MGYNKLWSRKGPHNLKGLKMAMTETKTVYESNGISIVRFKSYGFRCNTMTSEWQIKIGSEIVGNYLRLKDAKKAISNGMYQVTI